MTVKGKPLNAVAASEWEEVEMLVDSGACETVMPRKMCSGIRIQPSPQSLASIEYEVASGHCVPNLGERRCEVYTE